MAHATLPSEALIADRAHCACLTERLAAVEALIGFLREPLTCVAPLILRTEAFRNGKHGLEVECDRLPWSFGREPSSNCAMCWIVRLAMPTEGHATRKGCLADGAEVVLLIRHSILPFRYRSRIVSLPRIPWLEANAGRLFSYGHDPWHRCAEAAPTALEVVVLTEVVR
jgi:hypothetical protein